MNASYVYDPDRHEPGSVAAAGRCSHHQDEASPHRETCTGEAVVSFQDSEGRWQSGCSAALEQLVNAGYLESLGQKA